MHMLFFTVHKNMENRLKYFFFTHACNTNKNLSQITYFYRHTEIYDIDTTKDKLENNFGYILQKVFNPWSIYLPYFPKVMIQNHKLEHALLWYTHYLMVYIVGTIYMMILTSITVTQ